MKILIGIDDSPCSSTAVDYVMEQCWPKDSEFCVISVVEPYYLQYATEAGYVGAVLEAQQEMVRVAKKLVQDKVNQLKRVLVSDKVSGTVLEGPPAVCIMDMAKSWQADLIVVGSHGRRGFQKFFLGSVAENVARHATCSVEVVKRQRDDVKEIDAAVA